MTGELPEFIGWAAPQESSEIVPPRGPSSTSTCSPARRRSTRTAGFDRVLIGYFTNAPDGFLVAAHVAASTERLGLLLAHRPGFVAPTLAARKLATLDQLSKGRAAVHIISGGSDTDQARDGDFADHTVRYRRSAEYVRVLRERGRRASRSITRASSTGSVARCLRSRRTTATRFLYTAAVGPTTRSRRWRR